MSKIEKEWQYVSGDGFIVFSFSYPIDIFDRTLLPYIKPSYP
jgi:hypothetical protein